MSLNPLLPFIRITEEERIRRIGELLAKGIHRLPPAASLVSHAPTPPALPIATPEERILDYLRRHPSTSPKEFQTLLGLSRSRTYRALQHLLGTGQIARNGGRTTAATYRRINPSRN